MDSFNALKNSTLIASTGGLATIEMIPDSDEVYKDVYTLPLVPPFASTETA